MDVTLTINDRDFSPRLSAYSVEKEVTYSKVVTTMDGLEHFAPAKYRDVIYFSLFPVDDDTSSEDFSVLSANYLEVSYTDPMEDSMLKEYRRMRLESNLSSAFGIRSINGKRYYKGGTITLRAVQTE